MKIWLQALRVNQWTKNAVVFAAWFFAVADASQAAMARGFRPFLLVCAMALSFSLISSAFYLLNDVADYDADRLHPVKRLRPIAADLVTKISAVRMALALFAFGLAFPCYLVLRHPDRTWGFAVLLLYTVMQCAYSGFLKRVPYVDVATLSAGFVLRAVAGAAIISAYISPWLLVCTFSLSMFLALCKRKNEIEVAAESRAVLKHYHPGLLKFLIIVAGLASFGEYLVYALTSKMGERFPYLWITSVPVFFGIARYAFLAWRKGDVGRPERVLLTDRPLWIVLIAYALTAVFVVASRSVVGGGFE